MKDSFLDRLLTEHRGKTIGALTGLFLGVLIITLGFLRTMILLFFVALGILVGKYLDDQRLEDIWEKYIRNGRGPGTG